MRRVGINLLHVFAIIALMGLINAIHAMAQAAITDIAWNTDSSQIAVARDDGSLEIVSIDGQPPLLLGVSEHSIVSVVWSPVDYNILAITTCLGDIQILRVASDQHIVLLDIPSQQNYVQQAEWSPDGSKLATIGETGGGATSERAVKVWDSETGKLLASYEDGYAFTDIAWNPQHKTQLLITGVADHYGAELLLWDVHTQDTVWKVEEPDSGVLNLAWNPDGYWFATSTVDYEADLVILRVHDAETGTTNAVLPTSQRRVLDMRWSSSAYLAVSGLDEIEVWDVAAGALLDTLTYPGPVYALDWSPDGTKIAYGGADLSGNPPQVQIVDAPVTEAMFEAMLEAEAERNRVSCLSDYARPARLAINEEVEVVEDGADLRLRVAPDLSSTVMQTMAGGTLVTIVGGPACSGGYRWWQVQLSDGTVGWAVDADSSDYFLQPSGS